MNPRKRTLREKLKQERLRMSDEEVRQHSRLITGRAIKTIDWPSIRTIHCFTSIPQLNEVETAALFELCWHTYKHVKTFTALPIKGEWRPGLAGPGMFTEVVSDLPAFDVIFVPLLGFDESRHRLGYGGGYYDRFLATQPHARKIGLCYEQGKVEQIPLEAHDVSLDLIVTESKSY